jgi:uncharacterized protein (DUF2147 family)
MKKTLYLAATALLLASSAAYAGDGISFEINGQKIHIDASRNCSSLSCLHVTNNGAPVDMNNLNLNGHNNSHDDDDDAATTTTTPAPPAPPAVAAQPPAPAPAAVANNAPPAAANNVPPTPPAPPSSDRVTALPPAPPAPPPAPAAAPAVASNNVPPAPPAPPPAQAANTPIGLWQTEDNKGNVRIEQCGSNICGYAEKTNERILINMKPADGNKWSGRIHDPDSGSNYDSTIAMKGSNTLKVQGCAFGGLFCGGQTWKRIS